MEEILIIIIISNNSNSSNNHNNITFRKIKISKSNSLEVSNNLNSNKKGAINKNK